MKNILPILLCFLSIAATTNAQTIADAEAAARTYIRTNNISYNKERNIYTSGSLIHIFMYEDGNLMLSGYPTTTTEKSTFRIHLFTSSTNTDTYKFSAEGNYQPVLNVEATAGLAPTINRQDFPVVGPFTEQVVFSVKRISGANETAIATQTVRIAKTIHASLGTGFVYSTLKNPTEIHKAVAANGDSTLLADNPNGNTTLTIMATLYPSGRNSLMLPSKAFRDHYGIVIGTTIASTNKNFRNLYLGLQYDFAVGGSFVGGLDIAERQRIADLDRGFKFGKDEFTGPLTSRLYKQVGVGVFLGVQVDSRIFAKMFPSGG